MSRSCQIITSDHDLLKIRSFKLFYDLDTVRFQIIFEPYEPNELKIGYDFVSRKLHSAVNHFVKFDQILTRVFSLLQPKFEIPALKAFLAVHRNL